jgi:hypothetical protein
MEQIKQWKHYGVKIYKCNIRDIECGAFGKAILFTVSAPDDSDVGLCPLATAFGIMVTGFSYLTRDKAIAELAWRYLGSHE